VRFHPLLCPSPLLSFLLHPLGAPILNTNTIPFSPFLLPIHSSLQYYRVLCSPYAGIPRSELPPSVKAWVERNLARETVKKGLMDQSMGVEMMQKMIETGEAPKEPKWTA
jgi:hypothetical protein